MNDDENSTNNIDINIDAISARTYQYLTGLQQVTAACGGVANYIDILVIRDDFVLLRKSIENSLKNEQSIFITGHPGIGKTTFLYYVLLHRLQHKLPTATQFDQTSFTLFTANGVETRDVSRLTVLPSECWALIDSNHHVRVPSISFDAPNVRSILASSPRPDRWKEWVKQTTAFIIVSELPSIFEIAAVARALQEDVAVAARLVRIWGSCLRTVLVSLRRGPTQHKQNLLQAKGAATLLCRQAILPVGTMQFPNSEGSAIVFIRPFRRGFDDQGLIIESSGCSTLVPTNFLASILNRQLQQHSHAQVLQLFQLLSTHALTRSPAGWALEKLMHSLLVRGGDGSALRISSLDDSETRELHPAADMLAGTVGALGRIPAGKSVYWLPSLANFPGVHGAWIDDENIYALQATLASKHVAPSNGLRKMWQCLSDEVKTTRSWNFVVVCDDSNLASQLARQFAHKLQNFSLGTDHVDVRIWSSVLPRQV